MQNVENKLGMLSVNNMTIVGKLSISEDGEIDLTDCASFATSVMPTAKGELGQIYFGTIIGDLIEYPATAVVLTVEKASPFYIEYYKLVSGIDLTPPPSNMKIRSA